MPSIIIQIKDQINATIIAKIKAIGQAASKSSSQVTGLRGNIASATRSVSGFAVSLVSGNRQLLAFQRSARSTGETLRSLASGILLISGVAGSLKGLDAFQEAQNKLRLTTNVYDVDGTLDAVKSQERLNETFRQLYDLAQRARVPVSSLVGSYRRFDTALEKIGYGQKEVLDITETLAKSMTLSGTNATEASQAMYQLSQAFNKGKLDGDEFRTTGENIPILLDALTVALGKGRAELYKFSESGRISVKIMAEAIESLKDRVNKDFESMPRTITQGFTQLTNSLIFFSGELDKSLGVTNAINSAFDKLGDNLPLIAGLTGAAGAAFAVMIVPATISLIAKLLAGFLSVPAAIAVVVGYLAYYSDSIKVAGKDSASLRSTVIELTKSFFDMSVSTGGAGKEAQTVFDFLKSSVISLRDGVQILGIEYTSLFEALDKADVGAKLINGFQNFYTEAKNGVIELVAVISENFQKIVDLKNNLLDEIADGLDKIPFGGGAFAAASARGAAEASRESNYFGNFAEAIRQQKESYTELKVNEKTLLQEYMTIRANGYAILEQQQKEYYDRIDTLSKERDAQRLETQKEIEAARTPNPNALREANELLKLQSALQTSSMSAKEAQEQFWLSLSPLQDDFLIKLGFVEEGFQRLPESLSRLTSEANYATAEVSNLTNEANYVGEVGKQVESTSQSFNQAGQSANQFASEGSTASSQVGQAANQSATTISSSFSSAASQASSAISSLASSAIADFNAITSAANSAASAASRVGSSGGGGGGGFFGGLFGFASGGYTGDASRNAVTGFVHGQEFVMPAEQTKRFRPVLEAMRAGRSLGGSTSPGTIGTNGGGINVTIQNYAGAEVSTRQLSDSELLVIIDNKSRQAARTEAPIAIAKELRNANSQVSKSISRNTNTERRR